MEYNLNSPYDKHDFQSTFLDNRTVFGTFESPFRMIKLKAYCPKKKRKKFDTRAFIRPQQPN